MLDTTRFHVYLMTAKRIVPRYSGSRVSYTTNCEAKLAYKIAEILPTRNSPLYCYSLLATGLPVPELLWIQIFIPVLRINDSSMFLKISILLLILLAVCFAVPTGIANDAAVIRLCNASSPVSLETVNSVLGNRNMQIPQARNDSFKCFLLCLYVEYGWMDRDGGFELHTIKPALQIAQVPENRIRSLLYSCTSTESSDPCDRASIFTECFWSHKANELRKKAADFAMK